MNVTEQTILEAGLTKNESKVYLALLKLGSATVVEITKLSGVHRVNVYDVLDRLQKKGLISTIMQSNKRIYEAANPKQLLSLLQQKEEALTQIMPQLEQEFSLKKEKQVVHHFIGIEGVMRAYMMMLEQNAPLYAMGGAGLNRRYLKHRHLMWNKERIRRNIKMKVLYYEFTRSKTELGWSDSTVEIRYLPNTGRSVGMIDICGNLIVNLLPKEGEIMAIVIENKTLAETYRHFFEFMWQCAKK